MVEYKDDARWFGEAILRLVLVAFNQRLVQRELGLDDFAALLAAVDFPNQKQFVVVWSGERGERVGFELPVSVIPFDGELEVVGDLVSALELPARVFGDGVHRASAATHHEVVGG